MSYIDRPSRLRAPALSAAALINVGLFALATQLSGAGDPPSRPAQQALVTVTTTHSTPASQRKEKQRKKPKHYTALSSPVVPSAYPQRHPAVDPIPPQLDPLPARTETPKIALPQPPMPSAPRPVVEPEPKRPDAGDLLAAYSARLRALILARQPTTSNSSGQVTIGFEVAPTGALANSAVAASSGNARLDRAALSMVRRAAPFPRPDQAIPSDKLSFRIEVRFH